MKNSILFGLIIIIFSSIQLQAQTQLPNTKVFNGILAIEYEGRRIIPPKNQFVKLTDSLDKNLKTNSKDTTSLFYRALLYYTYNQMLAEPYQRTAGTLENLSIAKQLIERAIDLKMNSLSSLMLRAQIYKELCYRFTADEGWMFKPVEIRNREKQFSIYKELANKYYINLSTLDPSNDELYKKMIVKKKYVLSK